MNKVSRFVLTAAAISAIATVVAVLRTFSTGTGNDPAGAPALSSAGNPNSAGSTKTSRKPNANAAGAKVTAIGLKNFSAPFHQPRQDAPRRTIVHNIPLEETPMATNGPTPPDTTIKAFNSAADVLMKTLVNLDKSSILTSFNGMYAMAVCGKSFVFASADGTVIVFQDTGNGQMFETKSGAKCPFIGESRSYYLAKLASSAYVITTPTGEEITFGGAQNAEDISKPFTAPPEASPVIAALASIKDTLPADHMLYMPPDKSGALIVAGNQYILIGGDGSTRSVPSSGQTKDLVQTSEKTVSPLLAGDSKNSISQPVAGGPPIIMDDTGKETVYPPVAGGNEYDPVPPRTRDLNSIPPDLPTDPEYVPGQLECKNLVNKNEWELSLAERRIVRRLLAEANSTDASASDL